MLLRCSNCALHPAVTISLFIGVLEKLSLTWQHFYENPFKFKAISFMARNLHVEKAGTRVQIAEWQYRVHFLVLIVFEHEQLSTAAHQIDCLLLKA